MAFATAPQLPTDARLQAGRPGGRRWLWLALICSLLLHALLALFLLRKQPPPMPQADSTLPSYELVFDEAATREAPDPGTAQLQAPTPQPATPPVPEPVPETEPAPPVPLTPPPMPPPPQPAPELAQPAPPAALPPPPVPVPEAAPTEVPPEPLPPPPPSPTAEALPLPPPPAPPPPPMPAAPRAAAPNPLQGAMMLPRAPFPPSRPAPPASPSAPPRRQGMDLSVGPQALNAPPSPSPALRRGENAAGASLRITGAELGADWRAAFQAWLQRNGYYPPEAARAGEDGPVTVRFEVGRDGRVRWVRLIYASGSRWLDIATQALLRDRMIPPFPPGNRDEQATIDLTIHYILIRR
jgi:protein TonB